MVIPVVVVSLKTVLNDLEKKLEELEIRDRIEIMQTTTGHSKESKRPKETCISIFRRDSLWSLLFDISMILPNYIFKKCKEGYKFTKMWKHTNSPVNKKFHAQRSVKKDKLTKEKIHINN